jgi:hypothetical protein
MKIRKFKDVEFFVTPVVAVGCFRRCVNNYRPEYSVKFGWGFWHVEISV